MNFQLAGTGQSFKGAFAYYLHDKRQDPAGPHPLTAERVAWMEVRNLAHDDPAFVQGVMIATARSADQIKREAGIKATGRKATGGAVFSYSLQWHPENETIPDRAGMVEIVAETLKILGVENRQVAIIAHTDTAHPHVHVIVNRVDPATGKMLVLHKNADKLDEWAARYERERGQIVSPNRDAKHEARKQRQEQAGKSPPQQAFEGAAAPSPAPAAAPGKVAPAKQPEPKPATPAPALPADISPAQTPRPKTRAALLAEEQAAQKERHKLEWSKLAAANRERKSAVFAERIDFKAIAADHRAERKPLWSQFGKIQAAERKAFRDREKRLSGIVRNAIDAVRGQQIRGVGDDRGFLTMAFAFTLNTQARHAAFAERQERAKTDYVVQGDAVLQGKFSWAKAVQARKLEEVRKTYDTARAALIARQDLEKATIREGWKQIYAERDKLALHAERSRARVAQQTPQNYRHGRRLDRPTMRPPIGDQVKAPGPAKPRISIRADFRVNVPLQQEPRPVKPEFDRSTQLPVAKLQPEPMPRMSVPMPAPAPSPAGVPVPPARRMDPVPEADRVRAYAATPEGAKATQAQKAAPDALRRSYQPPPAQTPAEKPEATQRPPAADFTRNAAPAAPAPERPAYSWAKNAAEITGAKPTESPDQGPTRTRRPRR